MWLSLRRLLTCCCGNRGHAPRLNRIVGVQLGSSRRAGPAPRAHPRPPNALSPDPALALNLGTSSPLGTLFCHLCHLHPTFLIFVFFFFFRSRSRRHSHRRYSSSSRSRSYSHRRKPRSRSYSPEYRRRRSQSTSPMSARHRHTGSRVSAATILYFVCVCVCTRPFVKCLSWMNEFTSNQTHPCFMFHYRSVFIEADFDVNSWGAWCDTLFTVGKWHLITPFCINPALLSLYQQSHDLTKEAYNHGVDADVRVRGCSEAFMKCNHVCIRSEVGLTTSSPMGKMFSIYRLYMFYDLHVVAFYTVSLPVNAPSSS